MNANALSIFQTLGKVGGKLTKRHDIVRNFSVWNWKREELQICTAGFYCFFRKS